MLQMHSTYYNGYYAPTAYDSTRQRYIAPADNSKFGTMARAFRRNILDNHGCAQCREFFFQFYQFQLIENLNSDDKEVLDYLKEPMHECISWQTYRNPRAFVEVTTKLMLIWSIITWVCALLIAIKFLLIKPSFFISIGTLYLIAFPSACTIIHLIGKLVLRTNLAKDKNNVLLNRRNGTVSIPGKKGQMHELPFDEFDGYVGSTVNPSGSTDYHLIIAHRHSASFAQQPDGGEEPWKVCADWEQLQQYMDISKPLPDIPSMEPFRHKDPVTAEYDRKHGRPKDYWKNLDMQVAEKYNDASYKAASQYPWGLTREQALAAGWQPSGVGEGDWQRRQIGTDSQARASA